MGVSVPEAPDRDRVGGDCEIDRRGTDFIDINLYHVNPLSELVHTYVTLSVPNVSLVVVVGFNSSLCR